MVGNGGQCWWLGRWGPDVFSCSGLTKLLCENASEWSTQHGLIGMKTRLLDFCNVALETILPSKRNSGQTVPKIIPVTIWSVNLLELKGLAKKRSWPPQGMLRNGMFVDPICVESTIFSIFRCLGSVWRGVSGHLFPISQCQAAGTSECLHLWPWPAASPWRRRFSWPLRKRCPDIWPHPWRPRVPGAGVGTKALVSLEDWDYCASIMKK